MKRTLMLLLFLLLPALGQEFNPEGRWLSDENEIYTFVRVGDQLEMRRDYAPARQYLGTFDLKAMTLIADVQKVADMGGSTPDDIKRKALERGWPLRVDLRVLDKDRMEIDVYYNSVTWNPQTREISSIEINAGKIPLTLQREAPDWRWKEPGITVNNRVTCRTSDVPDIHFEPEIGRGKNRVEGADEIFGQVADIIDTVLCCKRLWSLQKVGASALSGDVGRQTYQKLLQLLTKEGGDQLGLTVTMTPAEVALNYLRVQARSAGAITSAAERFRQRAQGARLEPETSLMVETIAWSCAQIEVRRGRQWTDGGWRLKEPVRLVKTMTRKKPFPAIFGTAGEIKGIEIRASVWASKLEQGPALRQQLLDNREDPCGVVGLCGHDSRPAPPVQPPSVPEVAPTTEETPCQVERSQMEAAELAVGQAQSELEKKQQALQQWETERNQRLAAQRSVWQQELGQAERQVARTRARLDNVQNNRDHLRDYPQQHRTASKQWSDAVALRDGLQSKLDSPPEMTAEETLLRQRLEQDVSLAGSELRRSQQEHIRAVQAYQNCLQNH